MTDLRGFKYELKTVREVAVLKLSICEGDLKRCTEALERCDRELGEIVRLRETSVSQWRTANNRDDAVRLSAYGVPLALLASLDREVQRISDQRLALDADAKASLASWTLASCRVTQLDDDFALRRERYRLEEGRKEGVLADASWITRVAHRVEQS